MITTNYVPTLALRPAEMTGLEQLPGKSKDRMSLLSLLAPWGNSKSLERGIERISRAFPSRPFILDLDRDYHPGNTDSNAKQEFRELFDPQNAFGNWQRFVERYSAIQPCIQTEGLNETDILNQINAFQRLGRQFVFRIERDRIPSNIDAIVNAINVLGSADFAIVLEGGWVKDRTVVEAWFVGMLNNALASIKPTIPTVISYTTIPAQYKKIIGRQAVGFDNHTLVADLSRTTNRSRLIYGDWGSTRPRIASSGPMAQPNPRIDFPSETEWWISREATSKGTYQAAAQRQVSDPTVWTGKLNIWGEQRIIMTAKSSSVGISSAGQNVAARVNIHLHRQAFYGVSTAGIDFDDDWSDDETL